MAKSATTSISKVRKLQARYLYALVKNSDFQVDQIVTGSQLLAHLHGQPNLAFGLKSFTDWLNGVRNPSTAHRYALAEIFHLSFRELNEGIDGPFDWEKAGSVFTSLIAVVPGKRRNFVHHVTILNHETDLSRPAVYRHWAKMFGPWPGCLSRHFRHLKHRLYGWIPQTNTGPLQRYSSSLVAMAKRPASVLIANSPHDNLWFVRPPGAARNVHVGLREGSWLLLSDPAQGRCKFNQAELLGCATGEPLLTLQPFSVERLHLLIEFHEGQAISLVPQRSIPLESEYPAVRQ